MDEFIKRSIELCAAVYRVTDKFPKEEALRQKFRELSIAFIDFLCYYKQNPTLKGRVFSSHEIGQNIRALMAYGEVAKRQRWVDPANFTILEREYERLIKDFTSFYLATKAGPASEKSKENRSVSRTDSNKNRVFKSRSRLNAHSEKRRVKMLKLLRSKTGGVSAKELARGLRVSTKTVERYLKYFISEGVVSKQGTKRSVKFSTS